MTSPYRDAPTFAPTYHTRFSIQPRGGCFRLRQTEQESVFVNVRSQDELCAGDASVYSVELEIGEASAHMSAREARDLAAALLAAAESYERRWGRD